MIGIRDDYMHLNFNSLKSISDLKTGMMVQILESNSAPLRWEWVEITDDILLKLNNQEDKLKWVRIPNYAYEDI